jgi:hypothetical protein
MRLRKVLLVATTCVAWASTYAAEAPTQKSDRQGAAWPKGAYAALNNLPDWGGAWVLARPKAPAAGDPPREQPALKGEYLTRYQAWQKQVRENNGQPRKDTSNCMPPGMPNMLATGQYPIEFLFTPGRVTVLHEAWMQWRSIWTDGRKHSADIDPGIFGHSIGQWQGTTLVVDTVGIKPITELGAGIKHSDALHVTERIHQDAKDADTLYFDVTMEDPEALERPYHVTHTYKRQRDWNLMEFVCAENDRNPVDASGVTKFE